MKNFLVGLLAVVALLSIAANALLYLRYSSTRPVVTVGNEVIRRKEFQDAIETQAGKAVLSKMVFSKLVMQAAAKEAVMPTDADVDNRIKDMERRTPQLIPANLDSDPARMSQYRDALKAEIALENLRIKGVTVSNAEVAAFYAKNRKAFSLPMQAHTTMLVTENEPYARTAEILLRQKTPLDVIARQQSIRVANMNNFRFPVGALPRTDQQNVINTVARLKKPGDVATVPVAGHKYFLTFQIKENDGAGIPSLDQIRPLVTRMAKLSKAPSAALEMATLYQASKPVFNVGKYAAYFDDIQRFDTRQPLNAKKTASLR